MANVEDVRVTEVYNLEGMLANRKGCPVMAMDPNAERRKALWGPNIKEEGEDGEVWNPDGKSQDDFMMKDECIILNFNDDVIGHDNKYNAHKFIVGQPTGMLHRAFSVMLFDKNGRLLLQQRASTKITFPDVWTNTCCSHPLHGMKPNEVDGKEVTECGKPSGVKHAAVRKLAHELGVAPGSLDPERFTFVTRVHYFAADVITHGKDAPWGEHEIDYLLVYKLDVAGEDLPLEPHDEEVRATRWVSQDELFAAMDNDPSMPLWSPWFRIIANKFLRAWWSDLDGVVAGARCADYGTIHRFDCPDFQKVGPAATLPFLDALERTSRASTDEDRPAVLAKAFRDRMLYDVKTTTECIGATGAQLKQGAYGKVPTHKISMVKQLMRPFEVSAGVTLKCFPARAGLKDNLCGADASADVKFCNDILCKVSRSFAAVIQQLPAGVCLDICIFYLVLRALDTVEDDMTFYAGDEASKEAELRSFFSDRLGKPDAPPIMGCGEGDERRLLEEFGAVARVFAELPESSRAVISDITRKMGGGMADYVSADLCQGTKDIDAYNLYCHSVAGLVGEGLTGIFVGAGYEKDDLEDPGNFQWAFCGEGNRLGLANSMGIFLQKTNIIRDYLEDYVDGRAFWPREVWTKHAAIDDLGDFARPSARGGSDACHAGYAKAVADKGASDRALNCLNEMVADALELVPDVLTYLEYIDTPEIYRFCAIPQIMAIATLDECFDNPKLFTGVVKIRKGLAARLMVDSQKGHPTVQAWFRHFGNRFLDRVDDARVDQTVRWRIIAAATRIVASTPEPRPFKKNCVFLSLVPYAVLWLVSFFANWLWIPLLTKVLGPDKFPPATPPKIETLCATLLTYGPIASWWALSLFKKCLLFGVSLSVLDTHKYPGPPRTRDQKMADKAVKAAKIDYRTRQEEEAIAWEQEQRDTAGERAVARRKMREAAAKKMDEYTPPQVENPTSMFIPKDPEDTDGLYENMDPETKETLFNDMTYMTPEQKIEADSCKPEVRVWYLKHKNLNGYFDYKADSYTPFETPAEDDKAAAADKAE